MLFRQCETSARRPRLINISLTTSTYPVVIRPKVLRVHFPWSIRTQCSPLIIYGAEPPRRDSLSRKSSCGSKLTICQRQLGDRWKIALFLTFFFPARENSLIYVYAGEHEHIPTSPGWRSFWWLIKMNKRTLAARSDVYWIHPELFLRANLLTLSPALLRIWLATKYYISTPSRRRRSRINQTSRPDLWNRSREISHFLARIITFMLRPVKWMEYARRANSCSADWVVILELHSSPGSLWRLLWLNRRLKILNWCNCSRRLSLKVH